MNTDKMKNRIKYGYKYDFYRINEVKRIRNVRELWNEQELHILSGSKRRLTIPRGRVMHRLLEIDGY